MMMRFIIIVFLMLGVFFLGACERPEAPIFQKIEKIRIKGMKKGKVKLSAEAVFFNPNEMSVSLTKTDLDVFLDGRNIGKILQEGKTEIPGKERFDVPLMIDVPTKKLLGTALDLLVAKKIPIKYEGYVVLDVLGIGMGLRVPISYEDKVDIKL